jgi:hypothetical protein
MQILTQCDPVDDEMPRRARARIAAAPPLLALVDSQTVRCQRMSPATMAWEILPPVFAAIDVGEVDDRRTISREHAPATKIIRLDSIT